MKIQYYTLTTIVLLLIACAGSQAQVKKDLRLVLNTKDRFWLMNTLTTEVWREKKLTNRQYNHFTLALSVVGKDTAGTVTMQALYVRNAYQNEDLAQNEVTGYNSEAPDEYINASRTTGERSQNQVSKAFIEGMLNKQFTIYLNERTAAVKVTGIDTIVTESLKGLNIADPEYLQGYSQGIRTVYNNEAVESKLASAFSYVPGKPVSTTVGWSKKITVEDAPFNAAYSIKSVQADSINMLAVASPLVKNNMTSIRKGNLTIDTKTGLPIRSAIRNEIKPAPGNNRQFMLVLTEENWVERMKEENQ